jgi:hypothetical protein
VSTPLSVAPRLGCASSYTAEVWVWDRTHFDPARTRFVTAITGIISLYWERVIDDFSEARVRFRPSQGDDCCAKLAQVRDAMGHVIVSGVWPWSHELVLYRDGEPVWTGPIFSFDETVRPDETTDFIQINARDRLAWLDRRVIHHDMPFVDLTDLTTIGGWIVNDAFEPDPVGVTPEGTIVTPSGRMGRRTTRTREARAGDELREVARGGIDFTCIDRTIIIKGVRRDPEVGAPELRNRDFQSGVEIRIVGADAATIGYAVGKPPNQPDGSPPEEDTPPVITRAVAPNVDPDTGIDPFFGLIEALTNAETSDSEDFLDWMAHELVDENMPPPRTLSVPESSTLSPDANVSIHQLIPSRHFKLNINGTCSSLVQYMRLSHVEVIWEAGAPEKVGVTFIPGNVELTVETP